MIVLAVLTPAVMAGGVPLHSHYKDGPPARVTGGFGEDSCAACHFGSDENGPGGSVEISGVPDEAVAGERYPFSVQIMREGMRAGGFQLSARDPETGEQVGRFELTDASGGRVAILVSRDIQFVHHTYDGVELASDGSGFWRVDWVAPADGRVAVIFHAAGVAANDDDSEIGDFVYTTAVLSPGSR